MSRCGISEQKYGSREEIGVSLEELDPEEDEDRHHPDRDDPEHESTDDEIRDHAAFFCCGQCGGELLGGAIRAPGARGVSRSPT